MEEMRMFFGKINNGSPFGVIKEVFFYDYSPNNPNNSPKLKQFLLRKQARQKHAQYEKYEKHKTSKCKKS